MGYRNSAMKTIYLSGPIDDQPDTISKAWRSDIVTAFPGYKYLNPMRHKTKGDHNLLVKLEKADIVQSDVVLVFYPLTTAGTVMEIMYAFVLGKLIVMVNVSRKPIISPWLKYHVTAMVENFEDAFKFIDNYFEVPTSSARDPNFFGCDPTVEAPVDESKDMGYTVYHFPERVVTLA